MIRNEKGFTLIELLVVIAIILILAAILFPVILSAQKGAYKSQCMTNMKQIYLAINQYTGDNAGKVPPMHYYGTPPTTSYISPPIGSNLRDPNYPYTWFHAIGRYMKNNDLFLCPSITEAMSAFFFNVRIQGEQVFSTYGMNWRYSNDGGLGGVDPNNISQAANKVHMGIIQTLDSPADPAKTVLLIETQQASDSTPCPRYVGDAPALAVQGTQGGNVAIFSDVYPYSRGIRWQDYPFIPFSHSGGTNIILSDGHAGFVRARADYLRPSVSAIVTAGYVWW